MIINDPKKQASAILATIKPKTGEMQDMPKEEPEDESMAGLHAAAQDIMDAFIKRDVKALAEGLDSFCEMRDSAPHEESPDMESEMPDSSMQ